MKIIYICVTGKLNSVIAANIHLGIIRRNNLLSIDEITSLKYFCLANNKTSGLLYIGKDMDGNEIYTLGLPKEKEIMMKLIKSYIEIIGGNPNEIRFIDADKCSSPLIKLGIFLSMKIGLKSIGRQLVAKGLENYCSCSLTTAQT